MLILLTCIQQQNRKAKHRICLKISFLRIKTENLCHKKVKNKIPSISCKN